MTKGEEDNSYNEMLNIVDKILSLSTIITKEQFKDLHKTINLSGDVKMWVSLLDQTLKDLEFWHNTDPIKRKIAQEAYSYLQNDNYTFELISQSLDEVWGKSIPTEMLRNAVIRKAKKIIEKGFFIT